eukprot:4450013-Amphidinium_carterae.4
MTFPLGLPTKVEEYQTEGGKPTPPKGGAYVQGQGHSIVRSSSISSSTELQLGRHVPLFGSSLSDVSRTSCHPHCFSVTYCWPN